MQFSPNFGAPSFRYFFQNIGVRTPSLITEKKDSAGYDKHPYCAVPHTQSESTERVDILQYKQRPDKTYS